jgi:hypothetical protein
VDAGGYKHWSNPKFDGLPWRINEPIVLASSASRKRFFDWLIEHALVANERVEEARENPDVVLAAWTAKYGKHKNEAKDRNYKRQTPIFIKPKPQRAQDVPNPNKTPSLITIIDAGRKTGRTLLKPTGLSNLPLIHITASGFLLGTQIRIFSASGDPAYFTPGEDCFSEPSRFLVDVEWQAADGRVLHAQRTEKIPGGRGGGAAKLQIKEEDFVPAESSPAESEMRWWEDIINKSITDFAEQHPGEPQPIVRQDRHGNLAGQHFNMVRRTTASRPKRQEEMDARMAEIRRRKEAGETGEKMKLDELVMTTYFDRTLAEAGKLVGKGKEAMKKRRQRIVPKEMSGQEYDEMLWKAINTTYPTIEDEQPGWHALVKLERRPHYFYKLDVPARVTESEIDDAVNRAARAETIRIAAAEADRVGLKKLTKEDGKLNGAGWKVFRETRARVFKAFDEAEIHDLSFEDCRKDLLVSELEIRDVSFEDSRAEPCGGSQSPAVMSPLAAKVEGLEED